MSETKQEKEAGLHVHVLNESTKVSFRKQQALQNTPFTAETCDMSSNSEIIRYTNIAPTTSPRIIFNFDPGISLDLGFGIHNTNMVNPERQDHLNAGSIHHADTPTHTIYPLRPPGIGITTHSMPILFFTRLEPTTTTALNVDPNTPSLWIDLALANKIDDSYDSKISWNDDFVHH